MIAIIPNKSIQVILRPKISANRLHFVLIVDRYRASYIDIEWISTFINSEEIWFIK